MSTVLRIGTRDSALALWQAEKVKALLEANGHSCEIIAIKSEGDLDLSTPIYQMGLTGVFTKTLDAALLSDRIDLAVHSLKDVPTKLAEGLHIAAVLQRANPYDVLVKGSNPSSATVATGSLRRKSQWLSRYPNDQVIGLRGNVQTRLDKLVGQDLIGGIFAAAGLERLGLSSLETETLNWMLPAPAQGAIAIATLSNNTLATEGCAQINHRQTELCVTLERAFLNRLEGGCSSPIGAHAQIEGDNLQFEGALFSLEGSVSAGVARQMRVDQALDQVQSLVTELLENGGHAIMKTLRNGQNS
ncbi:MAG: hydroxymethylbilane synthase [Flavobacteriaceae bacterium]